MSIYKINSGLPVSTKIERLNNMILELNGANVESEFNRYVIDELITGAGLMSRYKRNFGLGNANTGASAFYNWKHVKAETGYGIWRYDQDISYTHNAVNKVYFDGREVELAGDASSEDVTAFDLVYNYVDSTTTYTDNTSEASSEGGTDFTVIAATADYLYVGHNTTFQGIDFTFKTFGSNYTLKIEYSTGTSTWGTMVSTADSITDETSNFIRDGLLSFTARSDWALGTVNSQSKYWIRISTTTTPTTSASAYSILSNSSVVALLSLSSSEITDEDWKWCHYSIPGTGSRIYVTTRNAGGSSYEGSFFITSSSTTANKANFFVYNHSYTADYEDSTYDSTLGQTFEYVDGSSSVITAGDVVYVSADNTVDRASSVCTSRATGAGIGICRAISGTVVKVQQFGKAYNVHSTGSAINSGDKLWVSPSWGCVTNDIPTANGESLMKQCMGIANETVAANADVNIVLHIDVDYTIV